MGQRQLGAQPRVGGIGGRRGLDERVGAPGEDQALRGIADPRAHLGQPAQRGRDHHPEEDVRPVRRGQRFHGGEHVLIAPGGVAKVAVGGQRVPELLLDERDVELGLPVGGIGADEGFAHADRLELVLDRLLRVARLGERLPQVRMRGREAAAEKRVRGIDRPDLLGDRQLLAELPQRAFAIAELQERQADAAVIQGDIGTKARVADLTRGQPLRDGQRSPRRGQPFIDLTGLGVDVAQVHVAPPQGAQRRHVAGGVRAHRLDDGVGLALRRERALRLPRLAQHETQADVARPEVELGLPAVGRRRRRECLPDREGLPVAQGRAGAVAEVRLARASLQVAQLLVGRRQLALQGGVAGRLAGEAVEVLEGLADDELPGGDGARTASRSPRPRRTMNALASRRASANRRSASARCASARRACQAVAAMPATSVTRIGPAAATPTLWRVTNFRPR